MDRNSKFPVNNATGDDKINSNRRRFSLSLITALQRWGRQRFCRCASPFRVSVSDSSSFMEVWEENGQTISEIKKDRKKWRRKKCREKHSDFENKSICLRKSVDSNKIKFRLMVMKFKIFWERLKRSEWKKGTATHLVWLLSQGSKTWTPLKKVARK